MGSRFRADRLIITALVVVLAAASCTTTPTEPIEVDDCRTLARAGVGIVEGYLVLIEELDVGVFQRGDDVPPELADDLADLDRRSSDLDRRMTELQCDPAELRQRVLDDIAGLESEGLAGEILLQWLRSGD